MTETKKAHVALRVCVDACRGLTYSDVKRVVAGLAGFFNTDGKEEPLTISQVLNGPEPQTEMEYGYGRVKSGRICPECSASLYIIREINDKPLSGSKEVDYCDCCQVFWFIKKGHPVEEFTPSEAELRFTG